MKMPSEVVIYTDGASRGNPGPAALGVVIESPSGEVLKEIKKCLGDQTNNYAEYMALLEGLKACQTAAVKKITVKADSQLMIRQMQGLYRVKSPSIAPLFNECRKLATAFEKIDFIHIVREENNHADRLANEALDGIE